MSEAVKIGYIAKAHGIKGEVFLKLLEPDEGWFKEINEIILNESKLSILKKRPHQEGYILILETIIDRNKAETLKGESVYVDKKFFESKNNTDEFFLNEIKYFSVFLNKLNKGKITGFASTQAHDLILVENPSGVYEVPWVDEFIESIDFEMKRIVLSCPEGLFLESFGDEENE